MVCQYVTIVFFVTLGVTVRYFIACALRNNGKYLLGNYEGWKKPDILNAADSTISTYTKHFQEAEKLLKEWKPLLLLETSDINSFKESLRALEKQCKAINGKLPAHEKMVGMLRDLLTNEKTPNDRR